MMKPKILKNKLTDNMYSTYDQFLTTVRSVSNKHVMNPLLSNPSEYYSRHPKYETGLQKLKHTKPSNMSKLVAINQNAFRSIYTSPNQQNDESFDMPHKLDSHHCTDLNVDQHDHQQYLQQKIQNKMMNEHNVSPSISRELEPKKSINTQVQSYVVTNNQHLSSQQTEIDKNALKLVQIQKYIQQINHKVDEHNVQLQNQKIVQRSNTSDQQFRQNIGSKQQPAFQKMANPISSTISNFNKQSKVNRNDDIIDQKLNVIIDKKAIINDIRNSQNNNLDIKNNVGRIEQKQSSLNANNKQTNDNDKQMNSNATSLNRLRSSSRLPSQVVIQEKEEGRKFSRLDTVSNLVNKKNIMKRKSTLKQTQGVIYLKLAHSYEAIIELTQQNIRNVISVMKNNERSKKFFGKALHQYKILKDLFIGNDQQFNMKVSHEEYMDYLNDIKKNQFGQIENMQKFLQKKHLYNPNRQKMDALKKFNILMQQSIIDEERKRFKHQIEQNNNYEKKLQNKQKQMVQDIKNCYKHDQLLLVQKLKDLNVFFKNLRLMNDQKQQNLINIAQQIDKTEDKCGNLQYVDKILRHKFNLYQNYDFLFKQNDDI